MLRNLKKILNDSRENIVNYVSNFSYLIKNFKDKNSRRKLLFKTTELIIYLIIYASVFIVLYILAAIIFWVFSNGLSGVDISFLTDSAIDKTQDVVFESGTKYDFDYQYVTDDEGESYYEFNNEESFEVNNKIDESVKIEDGTIIKEVDSQKISELDEKEASKLIDGLHEPTKDTTVRVVDLGNGLRELILTTLYIVFFALIFSLPIGLFTAIYLNEYDVNPKLNSVIHFAIDSLAGIPSIIFGLFGSLFFGITLGLRQSLLAGILTVSIMLLPIAIKSIEETLKSVPQSYREASYGLGATKIQTLFKVVIPTSLPGILVAVILMMGRVIGESAIFIFVVGTSVALPSLLGKGASLTVNLYSTTRESLDVSYAASIAVVIFVMIFILNISAKIIGNKLGGVNK